MIPLTYHEAMALKIDGPVVVLIQGHPVGYSFRRLLWNQRLWGNWASAKAAEVVRNY